MDTGTYYVPPYYDFEPVSCWASFSDDTYSLVDMRCLVENRGNTHDEYSLFVPQSSINAMESFDLSQHQHSHSRLIGTLMRYTYQPLRVVLYSKETRRNGETMIHHFH